MTREEAEVVLKVNNEEGLKKFNELEAKAKKLQEQFANAFKKGDTREIIKINNELQKTNRQMDSMRTNAANIRSAMVALNEATPRELQKTIKYINSELNSGRVMRGSEEWNYYIDKLKETQAELKKVKAEMAFSDDRSLFTKVKDGFNEWAAAATAAVAALTGLVLSGKSAVKAYADMEAEEANVRKFTGMTADQVSNLNKEFKKMDTRTARENLNKLAQEGGRLGKQTEKDVLGYVRAADQINVSLDDIGKDATLTLSKLTSIFGIEDKYGTERSLLKVGSVVNELSQNCSAAAPYLTEFTSRLGGIAAQSNLTIAQTMAYGAVLDTQNLAVEASATAVGQLITKIYKEPAKFAEKTGLEVKKFTDMVKTDMNGALIMLFEHLNKFGGMETLATVFDDLGTDGARAIPVLTALAGHVDELKQQQLEADKAFREGISITKEFNVQNNTVEAGIEKAKKRFNEMAVTLGEKLLPVMQHCISGSSMLLRVLSVIIDFIIENKKEIIILTSAIATYNLVLKAHTIWLDIVTLKTKLWLALGPSVKSVLAVGKLAVVMMTNTIQYFTNGLQVNYEMQDKWRKAMAAIGKAGWVGIIVSIAAAVALWTTRTKTAISIQKELNDIQKKGQELAAEQVGRLRLLEKAATDETKSLDERRRAILELNDIVPEYNGALDETTGLYTANKDALDKYIDSLIHLYEVEAAKEKLTNIAKKKFETQTEIEKVTKKIQDNRANREKLSNVSLPAYGTAGMGNLSLDYLLVDLRNEHKLENLNEQLEQYVKLERAIIDKYGVDALTPSSSTPNNGGSPTNTTTPVLPESDDARKKREKEERERQRKAKEALQNDLDEAKYLRDKAEADNLAAYSNSKKNYMDYLAEKERIDREYAEKVVEIHESHNQIDIAAYGQALLKREQLKKQSEDRIRKQSIQELDDEHSRNEREAIEDFYNPDGALFNNQKALNQRLLELDIDYMIKKAETYEAGAKEREQIERQINDRIDKDQLEKQKETAEAMLTFEREYRAASGSKREQLELDILKDLHEKKLISESEYQKAVAAIKEKYRKEDQDKARKTGSEYADMVVNLYNSFSKFFNDLGKEGASFWDNLSDAATSAYAVMGAALSQFSAYNTAERDAEVAKIEKRYEVEITAAGKNSKKVAKIEAQRDAEIAKVKKKYNDRAMKVELAQAIAQTAQAAIAAYASAAYIPGTGWIMAPIAAAAATAAGMAQVAIIKKQHEAESAGYYSGGFTRRDSDNHREVGVVHANEFVANHQAVANPAISPVLRLIDYAQRNNTIGSLTAEDVDIALGRRVGVSARGVAANNSSDYADALQGIFALLNRSNDETRQALNRLSEILSDGIEAKMIMDGEDGFHHKYEHFKRLIDNPKR